MVNSHLGSYKARALREILMATVTDSRKVKYSVTTAYMPKTKKKIYKPKLTATDLRIEIGACLWLIMGGMLFGFAIAKYSVLMSH